MNRRTHAAVIYPTAHCANKLRRRHPASPAVHRPRVHCDRLEQILPTSCTAMLPLRRNLRPAGFANRCKGKRRERRTADRASRGKKRTTQSMTQPTQKIDRRKNRHAPERSSGSGSTSRQIHMLRTRVATEVAPQSKPADPRRLALSIRMAQSGKLRRPP
jgi:hypothetical protein